MQEIENLCVFNFGQILINIFRSNTVPTIPFQENEKRNFLSVYFNIFYHSLYTRNNVRWSCRPYCRPIFSTYHRADVLQPCVLPSQWIHPKVERCKIYHVVSHYRFTSQPIINDKRTLFLRIPATNFYESSTWVIDSISSSLTYQSFALLYLMYTSHNEYRHNNRAWDAFSTFITPLYCLLVCCVNPLEFHRTFAILLFLKSSYT